MCFTRESPSSSGKTARRGQFANGAPGKSGAGQFAVENGAPSFRMIRGVVREMDLCVGNDTRRPPGGADMHDDARQRWIEGRFLQESY